MNVGLLCFNYSDSSGAGMDRYTFDLVSALRGRVNFTVMEERFHSNAGWIWEELVSPSFLFRVARARADVYHAVSHFGAKNAVLAGKSPVVATVHDLIPNDVPLSPDYYRIHPARRRWLNPVYWRFLKMCDHLITTSESTKRDAVRILNFKPERISVVPYGVEGRRFQPTVRKTYHSPKKVLYIGALDPGKGIFNLVQAFRRVTEELSEVELCIGGRGNQFAALKRMVGALGIANKVKFLGFVPNEELPYYYSSSDLFVFPSYYGFHLMDLDAMASGLPVVAGNVRDAPEYIGRAGLLVNPWQISELSGAIIKLLTDEDLYTQMSQEAITRASLFTTERMGNLTLEVYQRILSEDRP